MYTCESRKKRQTPARRKNEQIKLGASELSTRHETRVPYESTGAHSSSRHTSTHMYIYKIYTYTQPRGLFPLTHTRRNPRPTNTHVTSFGVSSILCTLSFFSELLWTLHSYGQRRLSPLVFFFSPQHCVSSLVCICVPIAVYSFLTALAAFFSPAPTK